MTDKTESLSPSAAEDWWDKPLDALSREQWERLCDGCGKCCLHKLQDEETEELYYTSVACRFLDTDNVRCECYADRARKNPDCLIISPDSIGGMLDWLPQTCAYRLRYLDKPLPVWHPLKSGGRQNIERCGHSVRHRAISERDLPEDADWEELILIDIV